MILDGGTAKRRRAAGYAALSCLALIAGSAIAATLLTGIDADMGAALPMAGQAAWFTIKQAILSTLLALGAAIPVAVALQSLHSFAGRRIVLALFALPLSLPAIAAVFGILSMFGRSGWIAALAADMGFNFRPDIYGLSGILIAHVFFNMPLAVRMLTNALEQIPAEHFKLAETLRFGTVARVRHLLWPVAQDALPSIAALIFLLCAASYTIVLTLGGGPRATTLQVAIQQALTLDFNPGRAALLTLAQLLLTLLVLALMPKSPQIPAANSLGGERRWHRLGPAESLASWAVLVLACGFTGLPLLALLLDGLPADHVRLMSSPVLMQALLTSAIIAMLSALLATGAALAIAVAINAMTPGGTGIWWTERAAVAALGIPPLLLGVGWFLLLAKLGQPFAMAPVMIVIANAIMALPFALLLLRPVVDRHLRQTDRLSAAVRVAGWRRLAMIDLPVLSPALAAAMFFAGALSFGDLGVVTLYGSDHVTTLPALIYRSMGSYRTDDAAGFVLYLVAITGMLAFLSIRSARHAA